MVVRPSLLAAILSAALPTAAHSKDVDTTWVERGQSVDVYWEINVEGKIFVAADSEGRRACLDYWWIAWPFGKVIDLGRHCGQAAFKLPGIGEFSIGAKLRAGKADARTRIRSSTIEEPILKLALPEK